MTFFKHGFSRMILQTGVIASVSLVLALGSLAASAATTPTQSSTTKNAAPSGPDPSANPVLANIAKMGGKLYYLGTRAGLDGWLIVKDGQMQIAYGTADKKNLLIGALFGENGENITGAQIKTVMENNKDLETLMVGAAQEQQAMTQTGAAAPATPAAMPSVAVSPGERLFQDLSGATSVTLGSGTPQLLMVMDPNCPHCQATWRVLRDAVFKNSLQLKMIPVAAPVSDNERAAAVLLHTADPLKAWDKYVGPDKDKGDKSQLAGAVDPAIVKAIRANHVLIDSWHIDQTPYLVYRGKDGKVKIVVGEPEKVSSILSDLVP